MSTPAMAERRQDFRAYVADALPPVDDGVLAAYWRSGYDTRDIGRATGLPEYEVANRLADLRDAAVCWRESLQTPQPISASTSIPSSPEAP